MKLIAWFCLCGLLASLSVAAQQSEGTAEVERAPARGTAPGQLLDRVVAIVNDGVVLQSELEEQLAAIVQRLRAEQQQTGQQLELPPLNVLRTQVLERLILQEIQMQRAARAGIRVNDEQLNAALADVAKRNGLELAQLPEAVAEQGLDYASYRESIRRELTMNILRQRDVVQRINVSPRELQQFLERQKNRPSELNEYNLSHILIAVPQAATPDQLDAAARRAAEVYERAKNGEDFARLAVQFSNSQTALEGGSLGWRRGPEVPTILTEIVAKLKVGEVSEPLRTPSGYHIVRLNDVRGVDVQSIVRQTHARHILMKPTELQDDATVRQKLLALRERILKGEDFAAVAKVTSEDPGSAADGGDLGWTSPGTFVPEFERVMDGLQDGEISEPFRTQFGWHIVQVLGRRDFDNTEELRRQRAFLQIRDSKAEEETELWLRRLRDEAFVEYRM
ncbi:MAG: peptidylprolyl isomerase [Steroidobacteraceae bacterium]|nr:peptidylprolyl isomerase [Steroidobacteraceae bacterium]MDW8259584.1 peptidylprolyl isomerase [Gammaproteobacteria bacterium]